MLWGVKTEELVREIGAQSVSARVSRIQSGVLRAGALRSGARQQSAGDSAFGS